MSNHRSFLLKYGTPDHVDSAIKSIAKTPDDDRTWDEKSALEDMVDSGDDRHINTMLDHHGINDNIRYHIAKYGSDTHRDRLLINHQNPIINKTIARYGNDSHRDKLINNKDENVRGHVAEFGNDGHREHLLGKRYPTKVELNSIVYAGHKDHRENARNLLDKMQQEIRNAEDRYGL